MRHEYRPENPHKEETVNAIGWAFSMIAVAVAWLFPFWGALFGLI